MRSLVALVVVALALAFAPAASAQPRITAPVTDLADAVPAEQEQQLTAKLTAHRTTSGVAVAVLVVPTTGSTSLEAYSMRAATAWRAELPGAAGAVLYVLAVRDRRHRLEVDDGARRRLPDARALEVLDAARPSLRSADYAAAVRVVMDGVLTALAPAAGEVETITETPAAPTPVPAAEVPTPAPTVAAPTVPPPSEGEKVCFGLFCLLSFLLGGGLLVGLVVSTLFKAGKAVAQSFSGTTYGHGGASHLHGHDASWSHSDTATSSWSSSDSSSSSSSDTSTSTSSSDSSSAGGGFSGGGASSDW